ncbi:MAG: hypothetical protein JSV12_00830 [Candidatus Bathyarchaeota archaeon]|nr:MAG: hypothetical protein JSV12_00830 [Candidatus Bathyarchaeota archaeon]
MWKIDEILMMLKDGNWHDLREIAKECASNEFRVQTIVSFLSKYDFMELKSRKARLRPLMLEFIDEIQRLREEEAIKS